MADDGEDCGTVEDSREENCEGENSTDTNAVVASQVMPEASETGEDVSIYQLKWVEMGSSFVPIIVQNQNGPCPLLALCNVLILRRVMKIPPGNTDVSSTYLLDLLGTYLLEKNKAQQLDDGEKANLEQNILDTVTIFPRLPTGLDVNVRFNSVSGWEFTREICLFDLVGVPLYHGWVVDPQNSHYYQAVHNLSYNQLVEKIITDTSSDDQDRVQEALLCQEFLETTASQLTYHGLCELNTAVKEGEFCVFFRNNHFNTLTKRNGRLFTLATDHGFLNELGYIWQSLSDIDGGGDFLDATFSPSPQSQSQTIRSNNQQQQQQEQSSSDATPTPNLSPEKSSTGSPGDKQQEEETAPHGGNDDDLDYQTALRLQRELYVESPGRQGEREEQQQWSSQKTTSVLSDHELAAALQHEEQNLATAQPSSTPTMASAPNTAEEYEQASAMDRPRRSSSSCTIL